MANDVALARNVAWVDDSMLNMPDTHVTHSSNRISVVKKTMFRCSTLSKDAKYVGYYKKQERSTRTDQGSMPL